MSHRRAIAGASAWTPLTPGGLVAWYDASAPNAVYKDATTLAANLDVAHHVIDQSGNGRTITTPGAGKELVFKTAQQNGRPALVGVGGDDSLAIASDLIGTGDVTVFAVFKAAGWGGAGFGRFFDNAKYEAELSTTGSRLLAFSFPGPSTFSAASSISMGVTYVAIITRTSTSIINFYINGILSGSANQSSGTPAAGTATYIGNRLAGDRGFDGNIYEIGVFTGILNASDIAALAAYCRNWWSF